MADGHTAERARQPEDLDRLFLERANAGDVDGVVELYEPQAVLAFPPGQLAVGAAAIREVYGDRGGGARACWPRGRVSAARSARPSAMVISRSPPPFARATPRWRWPAVSPTAPGSG